ncbi:hypothetical protein CBR_g18906 [Chara braunii]|uniref:Uncharacterized protein n=1 Tax=Chara braunii TaxID=69332 RepID=A0A388KWQ5_CHABU|nr:hypothetical protein CBR_g18906 [Chara braunii]|eukprot:GBG74496.1 hypothetical protein CBR_g18906 [Chara braunii]
MADMQRRLPLLLLVVVVFVFVVFLHVCLSCRPWKQRRKRRASRKGVVLQEGCPMAGMQARAVLPAAEGGRKPATTEPSQRYAPSMYSHLPSWETPLPPSDKESEGDELPTFPLGSESTQLLLQTVLAGGSASNGRGEYTTLLQQGLGDDDDGGVDLRFGLCFGGGREPSRTFIIDADPSPRGVQQSGSRHTEQSTLRGGAFVTGGVGPSASGRQYGSSAASPRNMSTQGNTRGKKRDAVVDDSQGQGRGRRQAPKAKRLRTEDASAGVPRRGAQGWAAAAEGDYDDEFTTEEEQAEATTSEVRESCRQRSSDHTALKRMLTPPPEAQQLRGRETRTEKAPVVDLGGDDDEPLERRRIRIRTTATPPPEVAVRVAANERPVSDRLPATPCQPRQRNEGGNGGSVQRGGGGEVVADVRAVGAEEGGAAGAGGPGTVAAVAMARKEAAVGATAREEARGERKGDRETGEPGSSRVHRSVMTKDLIDRAVLWVDGKAFWTTGEGRRLYNIVHETREYFVAIASGLPPPTVPRSVVLPKSSTRVGRIVDQSQLQQAISRAAAVENVALRILHGWVFKSGNRPRGYHVAFQYSLESFATDIARAMWYGEEWCDVVSPAVCAHTIDLSMDLPLWFAGANIEDRPDGDDMAAHQESTVICVAYAFRAAVQMGALIDGDFISHERLCRVADCFRLLLAACMWIMRMAGDDPRSHYEAYYVADLVAKPTLVAVMHRSFDHRRSVVLASKVVTERLGKAKATFEQHPDYIPHWAPCGIGFRHDASITGPEDVKKLDWLGSGPLDDDNNNDGKDDA